MDCGWIVPRHNLVRLDTCAPLWITYRQRCPSTLLNISYGIFLRICAAWEMIWLSVTQVICLFYKWNRCDLNLHMIICQYGKYTVYFHKSWTRLKYLQRVEFMIELILAFWSDDWIISCSMQWKCSLNHANLVHISIISIINSHCNHSFS